jgi:hypothetical protein
VADELQNPPDNEKRTGVNPEPMEENSRYGKRQRQHNQRDADAVTYPVDRIGMAGCILRDPLFVGSMLAAASA